MPRGSVGLLSRCVLYQLLKSNDRAYYQQTIAAIRAQLDEPTFLKAWTAGNNDT
jgi:hypothetical protein